MAKREETLLLKKYIKEMDKLLKTKNLTNEVLGKAISKLHKHTLNEMSIIRKDIQYIILAPVIKFTLLSTGQHKGKVRTPEINKTPIYLSP